MAASAETLQKALVSGTANEVRKLLSNLPVNPPGCTGNNELEGFLSSNPTSFGDIIRRRQVRARTSVSGLTLTQQSPGPRGVDDDDDEEQEERWEKV